MLPPARGRVTGKLAGVSVGFDVEVHAADEARLELSADGPVGFDVRYDLLKETARRAARACRCGATAGSTGRLVANATAALLSAGALDSAAGRIAQVAESQPRALAA